MTFLPEGSITHRFNGGSLDKVVAALPPKAKQAMFSAATHGLIRRGTWNGCAFNKAGLEVGGQAHNTASASELFGCSAKVVNDFIHVWDSLPGSDAQVTAQLRETIEKIGLFSEPTTLRQMAFTVRKRVFTSYETKMKEAFDASNAIAPVEGAAEVGQLLSSCAS